MSGKENMLEPQLLSSNTPAMSKTTQVIDALHSQIDELKASLERSESKVKEHKQKYDVVTKRSQQLIENMTNTKHENDMMNAMLQRKERRIKDLEDQVTELLSRMDTMEFDQRTKETRLQKLQENENRLAGELEVSKISYDTLLRSQKEYKSHYDAEIRTLQRDYSEFLKERESTLNSNISKFDSNGGALDEAFKKLTNKSNMLEALYRQKNNAIVEALKMLALAAKDHGTKTIRVLNECEEVLNAANRQLPSFEEQAEHEHETDSESGPTGHDSKQLEESIALSADSVSNKADTPVSPTLATPAPPTALVLPANLSEELDPTITVSKRNQHTVAADFGDPAVPQLRAASAPSAQTKQQPQSHNRQDSNSGIQRRTSMRKGNNGQARKTSNNSTINHNNRPSRVSSSSSNSAEQPDAEVANDGEPVEGGDASTHPPRSGNHNNKNRRGSNRRGRGKK